MYRVNIELRSLRVLGDVDSNYMLFHFAMNRLNPTSLQHFDYSCSVAFKIPFYYEVFRTF